MKVCAWLLDSLVMELTVDDLELRVSKAEEQLQDALSRLSRIEHQLSLPSVPAPPTTEDQQLYIPSPAQHQPQPDVIDIFSEDDDFPPLPPPIHIAKYNDHHVTASMDTAVNSQQPAWYEQQSQGTANFHLSKHPYQPSPKSGYPTRLPPSMPLQPLQLASCYNSPPSIINNPSPFRNNQPVMQCFPVEGRKRKDKKASLPSIEIAKENLLAYDIVLKQNASLHH